MSESVDRAVNAMKEQIDAPTASYFSSCVHCGICADACLFYTETGDPQYTPIHKLDLMRRVWEREYTFAGRIKKWLGLSRNITENDLTKWETLVYDSCTMCGRCSLYCPVGNDIVSMVRKMREAMVASGHAPEGLRHASKRSVEIGSPMGITAKTLEAQIKHAEKETGLEVPLDKEGVDYMMLLSSAEIAQFHEIIPAVTRIFHQAGVTWTLCSTAFEGTNSGIQIGSSDIAAELINRIVDGAQKLKVNYVISPECGHAYTALRWEGPNLIGKPYPFEVVHIIELLDQLRARGKLKVEGKDDTRQTFHDPCQMVRRGGVVEQPRTLMNLVATDFVEMPDHGMMNWCCGGGGGVSANERAEPLRRKVFSAKKQQLDQIGVERIVTACSNCRNMLEEGLEDNNMDEIEVIGLSEWLAEYLATPSADAAGDKS
ncbi:MAG: (Fe-S)-binding protein [Thiohalophilus sp.]|uniref:(Fe-S)-binding protein n=1 Tax=Thiohalophilus sp. TaxID=3028392 RepID=UPI002870251E|nr:(Fe-S)-binding protein [Thiohalophilus sp.]MDR9435797.1 (Fe-S)-binding protein [Thiohalophilus sp.]